MATLSVKKDLVDGIWQELATPCVAQFNGTSTMQIVNADALPVGDVPEAQSIFIDANLNFNVPAAGSLYVRASYGTGTVKAYGV